MNWNTMFDKPIILGAHWDVVENTTGFNDNGSGMAALLEAIRVIMSAKCFKPAHTIIFVAFDSEESGSVGSYEYVRRQIIPYFIRRGLEITGAIILDTLMNFDETVGSQNVPEKWGDISPQTTSSIHKNHGKGDFVAVIGRDNIKEARMMNIFTKWFKLITKSINRAQDKLNFKSMKFTLNGLPSNDQFPSEETLLEYSSFWRSDNARFWYYREIGNGIDFKKRYEQATTTSLPAILVTDTGTKVFVVD